MSDNLPIDNEPTIESVVNENLALQERIRKLEVPPCSPLCLECKEVRTGGYLCQACSQKWVAESPRIAEFKEWRARVRECVEDVMRRADEHGDISGDLADALQLLEQVANTELPEKEE